MLKKRDLVLIILSFSVVVLAGIMGCFVYLEYQKSLKSSIPTETNPTPIETYPLPNATEPIPVIVGKREEPAFSDLIKVTRVIYTVLNKGTRGFITMEVTFTGQSRYTLKVYCLGGGTVTQFLEPGETKDFVFVRNPPPVEGVEIAEWIKFSIAPLVRIEIVSVELVEIEDGVNFSITVKNIGVKLVTECNVTIPGIFSFDLGVIEVDHLKSGTVITPKYFNEGVTYTVLAKAKAEDGETFETYALVTYKNKS
ncbi:MAG: hypothetical protein ACPL1I_09505 [bacterium]